MEIKATSFEVHPDYGSLVVSYVASSQYWFETGSNTSGSTWKASWIYSAVSFGSTDFVLKYSGEFVPGAAGSPSPPTGGDEYQKISTWTNSGLTKLVLSASSGLFKIFAADSGGSATGSLLGVLSVQTNGDLKWWQAATGSPGPITGKKDSLYFQAETSINITCASGESWYAATDPKQ